MARSGLNEAMKRKPGVSLTVMIGVPHPRQRMQEGGGLGIGPGYPPDDEDDGEDQEGDDDEEIVMEAVAALRGESKNPQEALRAFVQRFGRDALEELRQMVQGGAGSEEEETLPAREEMPVPAARGRLMRGTGSGLDDSIPARNGDQEVLLSDGEFVVPADVVSMLGDGSTEAGARQLERMMSRVRREKTGRSKQARALKHARVMPR